MTVEEASGPPEEVWPENVTATNVFISMATQWRLLPQGGVLGLDYNALPGVMEMVGVDRKDWPDTFDKIRVMEDAAMEELRKRKK